MSNPFVLDDTVKPTKLETMTPNLEFVLQSRVLVAPVMSINNLGQMGTRLMLPIIGGDFEGPLLRGRIVAGGGDWPLVRNDGVGLVDARYTYETDDGVFINIRNTGYRHGSPEAIAKLQAKEGVPDPESYYLRTYTVFEAPPGPYEWLARHVFVGIGERHPHVLFLRYYKLL
ncbi:DUF3237 family protein [Duganella sp. FT94W]|uniref:UPF0311 protein GTP38_08465 n=1 Tax=Duganella lactea TaxID=2692173 RepID=A0ABW9V501_9BURK|nr:DUF3237 domain-containing protein [Duganella lactea]MYM34368.1 DUF3237 family protein [Duganella lactea]